MNQKEDGLVIREAHFPGRAPIDAYGNGGFRFAEMSHIGSIMCLPSGIHSWVASKIEDLDKSSFGKVFEESNGIEILLIGTGPKLVPISDELRQEFRNHGIMADSMGTGAAVRTFNVLLSENRAVATCLLAVE